MTIEDGVPRARLSETVPAFDVRATPKRVGLIVLSSDHTSESDFARMLASERVGVFVTRVAFANPVNAENLRAMQPDLTAAAGLILPDESLDVVCYSCTSASVEIGDTAIAGAVRAAKPDVAVVTPALAAVAGLRALGVSRLNVLTPYSERTSRSVADHFSRAGFDVTALTWFGLDDDRVMARITRESLVAAACDAVRDDSHAQALFISCTALRSACAVHDIEQAIGRPVVTSNQATTWMCRRLVGETSSLPQWGRLHTLALNKNEQDALTRDVS